MSNDHRQRRANIEICAAASGSRTAARIQCCRCPGHHEIPIAGPRLPTDALLRLATNAGWRQKGTNWLCPAHATKPPKPDPATTAAAAPPASTMEPTMTAPKQTPTAAPIRQLTPKETRSVMTALEAYFDEAAGAYTSGMTDAKIAAEVDVPAANVAAFRREAFGEIKVPVEITEARGRVDAAVKRMTTIENLVSTANAALRHARDEIAQAAGEIAAAEKLVAQAEAGR